MTWLILQVACYTFTARGDDELSFVENDEITVVQQPAGDWWLGQLHGKVGWFPANHVIPKTDAVTPPLSQRSTLSLSTSKSIPKYVWLNIASLSGRLWYTPLRRETLTN